MIDLNATRVPTSRSDEWLASFASTDFDYLVSELRYGDGHFNVADSTAQSRREWNAKTPQQKKSQLLTYFYSYVAEPYQVGGKLPDGAVGVVYDGSTGGQFVSFPGGPIDPVTGKETARMVPIEEVFSSPDGGWNGSPWEKPLPPPLEVADETGNAPQRDGPSTSAGAWVERNPVLAVVGALAVTFLIASLWKS